MEAMSIYPLVLFWPWGQQLVTGSAEAPHRLFPVPLQKATSLFVITNATLVAHE